MGWEVEGTMLVGPARVGGGAEGTPRVEGKDGPCMLGNASSPSAAEAQQEQRLRRPGRHSRRRRKGAGRWDGDDGEWVGSGAARAGAVSGGAAGDGQEGEARRQLAAELAIHRREVMRLGLKCMREDPEGFKRLMNRFNAAAEVCEWPPPGGVGAMTAPAAFEGPLAVAALPSQAPAWHAGEASMDVEGPWAGEAARTPGPASASSPWSASISGVGGLTVATGRWAEGGRSGIWPRARWESPMAGDTASPHRSSRLSAEAPAFTAMSPTWAEAELGKYEGFKLELGGQRDVGTLWEAGGANVEGGMRWREDYAGCPQAKEGIERERRRSGLPVRLPDFIL